MEDEYKVVFGSMDTDKDGKLSKAEVTHAVGLVKAADPAKIVAEIMKGKEFLTLEDYKGAPKGGAFYCLGLFFVTDKDHSGEISMKELEDSISLLDPSLEKDAAKQIFDYMDEDHSGAISFAELFEGFKKLMG